MIDYEKAKQDVLDEWEEIISSPQFEYPPRSRAKVIIDIVEAKMIINKFISKINE